MSTYDVDRYRSARGSIAIHLSAADANRTLLALEHLDQGQGLDPALAELRESIKAALVTKSSGDTDSAPSTE
jgi:hypothetical protein